MATLGPLHGLNGPQVVIACLLAGAFCAAICWGYWTNGRGGNA